MGATEPATPMGAPHPIEELTMRRWPWLPSSSAKRRMKNLAEIAQQDE